MRPLRRLGDTRSNHQLVLTFLIFLISESSSDGAAAGLAWIFSLSLSNPAICGRGSHESSYQPQLQSRQSHGGHLNQVFMKTFPQVKRNKQRGTTLSCLALNVSIYFTAAPTVTAFGGGDATQGGAHAYSPRNLISIVVICTLKQK